MQPCSVGQSPGPLLSSAADTIIDHVLGCRVADAADKQPCGVAGSVESVARAEVSTQPICAFDWSPDRLGLFACAALDQSVYVGIATNLQTA